jgi:c-di-AMP phosphodiesterase-like protein
MGLAESKSKESSKCLLTSLVLYTDNFKDKLTAEIFESAGSLMKNGADLKEIQNNIYKNG